MKSPRNRLFPVLFLAVYIGFVIYRWQKHNMEQIAEVTFRRLTPFLMAQMRAIVALERANNSLSQEVAEEEENA